MHLSNQQNFLLTLILAMALKIAPFPFLMGSLNPDWVLLVLIYWILALPYRNGIFQAWIIGLLMDVLTGRVLGEYALTYSLIAYSTILMHKQLRQYPLVQQSLFVFACLLVSKILIFAIESLHGITHFTLSFWLPIFTGTLLWPFVHSTLHFIRSLGRQVH